MKIKFNFIKFPKFKIDASIKDGIRWSLRILFETFFYMVDIYNEK